MLEKHVAAPRSQERQIIERGFQTKKPVGFYRYNEEPFRLRRKDFWPLPQASKLLKDFIPNLCHESDGLIFQVQIGSPEALPLEDPPLPPLAAPSPAG